MADGTFDADLQEWVTDPQRIVNELTRQLRATGNLKGMIPLLFRWAAKPVTLDMHFPLEVFFYHNRPRRVLKRCGRQVGKSFQNALELILRSILIPNWNTLYVTPLFEQVRRFSTQYVHALVAESPAKEMMTLKGASKQVLQRTFQNHSTLYFTYAQRDANRARGINANELYYDEYQMMSRDVIPVLQQVMGGSLFGEYESFAGTSLSHGNILEETYRKTTMSVWMIRCRKCGYDNVASIDYDLVKMIGPVFDQIDTEKPGLVCAKCSKNTERGRVPLFTEDGRWWHRKPEMRSEFLGVHIPQPICPWHATDRDRWLTLNNRIATGSQIEVYNEILGEPCDSSFKPISMRDLEKAACLGHKNDLASALGRRAQYSRIAMGIDWGGGGRENVSRTKAAIVGISPTGKADVLYGVDLNFAHDPMREILALMVIARKFGVEMIVHDAGGGVGADKEAMMHASHMLNCSVIPMSYVGNMSQRYVNVTPPRHAGESAKYTIDKARTLTFICQAIKQGFVRFFDYDYVNDNNCGLLHDFTALTAEVAHRVTTSDVLLVDREEGMSDDFAHAVNFACVALWTRHNCWPKLNVAISAATLQELAHSTDFARPAEQWSIAEIEAMLENVQIGA